MARTVEPVRNLLDAFQSVQDAPCAAAQAEQAGHVGSRRKENLTSRNRSETFELTLTEEVADEDDMRVASR